MRIVVWNIQQGGGARLGAIEAELARHDADLIVLNETRLTAPTAALRASLGAAGYRHQRAPAQGPAQNSILIASRRPLSVRPTRGLPPALAHRLLRCSCAGLDIVAAYFPAAPPHIMRFYDTLLPHAASWVPRPALLLGDLNSGLNACDTEKGRFSGEPGMRALMAQGWTDAWRHVHADRREYTWVSQHGNGYRIDHGFVSPSCLPALRGAVYEHGARESGASDHSLLRLELAWPPGG